MRQVRLSRPAFINACYCNAGSVVTIGDGVALAPFMTEIVAPPVPAAPAAQATPAVPPAPPVKPEHTVTVHYRQQSNDVDIDVNGAEMHIADAALKIEVD